MLDSGIKPCFALLNRDDASLQSVVGPNQIYYDATNGEDYKVLIPAGYLNMPRHPITDATQPLIEIYGIKNTNRSFKLAN